MKVEPSFFSDVKKKSVDCDLENKREKVLTDWHSSLDYNNAIIEDFLGQ